MITFLIISLILNTIVYKSIDLIHKNKYLNKLKDTRKYLSDQEILAFYTNSKLSEISILELWNEVATNFDVPPGYLRPEDHLAEMGILQISVDHPKLEDLTEIAIERKKSLNKPIDLESISTLDDYIKAFALKA
ncbi:hypothetical protein BGI36_03560 [Snodgrassella communis]|uniref:hypothetical protein n=1 Tax=Snodgrassella communis TaxID=2946699 RepID=UPI000C1EC11C|nr:hypothetical protein [Snodgrassella communis]PIT19867.1 hypothetical protein BGI35_09255 [Snodgrassella communis]PIT22406.1 hypothetical protein BGI36_03560 [Snodgrassella communis]